MVTLKSAAEIAAMREAGRVVARALAAVAAAARPGVRLIELDELAAAVIAEAGAKPSFLGYHPAWAPTPYPGVVCLSVNDQIVHGIPTRRALVEGDLLSIDCGAHVDGYHGDAAVTVPIGTIDDASAHLAATAEEALAAGIAAARPGNRIGDISRAIQQLVESHGYGLPAGMGGHGIGTAMHEEPDVPNTGRPGRGRPLVEGLVIAIEPMLMAGGGRRCATADDGWTIVTVDGSRAAHAEHTVAITADGPVILTVP
ncbi:type I methionyl aminopeptidase [Luedemannella helvata]|uniref:Methionine aminopeptidase n=1 Tax=Luedemannella helvata TaxID=349315 RepID=A0ABN2KNK6_9ACTN